ncbi:MAG TPA: hypothetical protein VLX92_19715 [Kofleriaceae bacterium]|nr:hypothetical protein [Kofleriaceae bacterium]
MTHRIAILVAVVSLGGRAHADDAHQLAATAAFTPGVMASEDHTGYVVESTLFDGAAHDTELDALAELPVWGPLRVVARVDNFASSDARPGAGLGVQILDEARYGVALSAYSVYKAEGFTEPDGELESTVAAGRQLGPVHAVLDVTYGFDFDGHDRDGELALAALVEPVRSLFAGIAGRYRDALGSQGESGVIRDFNGGATVTYNYRAVAFSGVAGVAGVSTRTSSAYGPSATLAIGMAF